MYINFSDLPGFSNLFLDYMYEFENVKRFYKRNFRDTKSFPVLFEEIAAQKEKPRTEIKEIIKKQYEHRDPSLKTKEYLDKLDAPNTITVFTGQQLGFLGGPLYTFYKLMTTVKLAEELQQEHPDYTFVPCFWLGGDDHDFDEIRSVNLLDNKNELQTVTYEGNNPEEEQRGSTGFYELDEQIDKFLQEYKELMRDTDFSPELYSLLEGSFAKGKELRTAFTELLYRLFDKKGIVLVDPQDAEVKRLLVPVIEKEIRDFRKHTEKIISMSAQLEEQYHAQVKVRPVNLFLTRDGVRLAIEPLENGGFTLKRKRVKFTQDELIELLHQSPELFTHNVLMRPICQDYLFPNAFYIAGPGEINYFAQLQPLYGEFSIPASIVYPRASATLLESFVGSTVAKFNLQLTDFFRMQEDVVERAVKSVAKVNVNDVFDEAIRNISAEVDKVRDELAAMDKTMADAGDRYRQKVEHSMNEYRGKAVKAWKRTNDVTVNQAEKVLKNILPNGSLQEREFNFAFYANKYGIDFLEKVWSELNVTAFEHQIIEL